MNAKQMADQAKKTFANLKDQEGFTDEIDALCYDIMEKGYLSENDVNKREEGKIMRTMNTVLHAAYILNNNHNVWLNIWGIPGRYDYKVEVNSRFKE